MISNHSELVPSVCRPGESSDETRCTQLRIAKTQITISSTLDKGQFGTASPDLLI